MQPLEGRCKTHICLVSANFPLKVSLQTYLVAASISLLLYYIPFLLNPLFPNPAAFQACRLAAPSVHLPIMES